MDLKNLLFKKEERIAFITLNRPEVHNALNHAVWTELEQVIGLIKSDPEIRAVILTGSGEKAFVSGADVNDLSAMDITTGWENARYYQSILNQLDWLRTPSVAAINGYCLGGRLELAMACTLRVASENAKLGLPELGFGIVPGVGGTQRLMRLVGRGKAAEMILTAQVIDAQEAFRIGLVNSVVPRAEVTSKARAMADTIVKNPSTSVRLAMDLILRGVDMSLDNSLAFEAGLSAISFMAPETAERMKAFLERKK